jgi:hypothetical protein
LGGRFPPGFLGKGKKSIDLETVVYNRSLFKTGATYFNLMFTNHGKEDGIHPLKRDSKAQNKDQRSIVTTCKNT